MNLLTGFASFRRFLPLACALLLLPVAADAQVLSVSSTSVSVQASAGTNAPSQSVRITNAANGSLKWSVVQGASWLRVSPTNGVNSGNLTLAFQTASLGQGQYDTSFRIESNGGSQSVSVRVTIGSGSSSGSGGSTPPSSSSTDITVSPASASPGGAVTVNFSVANPTGTDWIGLAPAGSSLNTYLDWKYASTCARSPGTAKASGSCSFTAPSTGGTYELRLFAADVFTLLDSASLTVSTSSAAAPQPPPAPASGYGPQSSIACPAGAVDIWPGVSIQTMVDSHGGSTTFCIRAGVHYLRSSITPKTGDTFVGEYGAVLEGSGWSTSDDTQAAFRGHNQDIDYVTIRNLVIRNMPQRGIHAFYYMSNNWTIEFTEIASSRNVGIVFPANSIIRNNYIHHNTYSGYMGPYAHNSVLEGNEIAYNGWEQKVTESANVTFRNNFVHHNVGAGIWFDSDNTGTLVEGNRVEDNGHVGIWYEISGDAVIRNNAVRRNADTGVFISTSKGVQVYNNTIEDNFRGITFFVNCPSVGGGQMGFDLVNNSASDNTIAVGTRSGALASLFSWASCTSTQAAAYLNGSKNLTFYRNRYYVPSTNAQYWYWGNFKYWWEWQAIPQDAGGGVNQ